MHDVQQVTLSQAAPTRLTQQMTFTVLDCPAMTDCVGGDFQQLQGSVTLQHHGRSSTPLSLKATATEIASAVGGLRDSTYSELVVSSIATTNSTVVWTLELTTPWAACSSQLESPPLFSAQISAKVTVDSVITAGSSCLDGGVDISLSGGDAPPVFLPWDATADAASIVLNTLVQAETDAHGVYVTRAGDGHSTGVGAPLQGANATPPPPRVPGGRIWVVGVQQRQHARRSVILIRPPCSARRAVNVIVMSTRLC